MLELIVTLIFGIIMIVIGSLNMKGNISSLHLYHRHRVSEKDRIPFGRKVGLGTIIIGSAIIIFSILTFITFLTNIEIFNLFGNIVLISGLAIGLIISFYAMFRYNKGIF